MKDANKTKKQLIGELSALRRRVAQLEGSEAPSVDEEHYRSIVEQRTAELKKSEEQLRMMKTAFEQALDPIVFINPDGRFIYANEASVKESGYPRDKLLSLHTYDIGPDYTPEIWLDHFQELKRIGSMRLQNKIVTEGGDTILYDVRSNYIQIGEKEFIHSCGRDITALKQAELKLKESEERFRAFMDNYPAAIYMKDEAGRHIYGNRAILELTGMESDEFIGTTSHDFFPPAIANRLDIADQKVRETNTKLEVDEYVEAIDGKTSWRAETKFPIQKATGEIYVGGVALDITDRKLAENELKKAYLEIKHLNVRLKTENIYLREEIELQHKHDEIIGKSEAVREMLRQAEQVAKTDSTVLILGETGTGKELLARAIHRMSSRHHRTMIIVNCAALPATLIESEMFGREKGAFTGALSGRIGRFEIADGSTIFLDEIGELTSEVQMKLLRVLEKGDFERLGSNKTNRVNVRIIAATNRDLVNAVHDGSFRRDLFYRLNVFPINVPSLQDRIEDLELLVWAFVKEYGERMGKRVTTIPKKTINALKRCPWRGNIRELRNLIEQSMIITKGSTLEVKLPGISAQNEDQTLLLKDVERNHILKILKQTGWRVRGKQGAAELLGLKPTTLESRMKKLQVVRPK